MNIPAINLRNFLILFAVLILVFASFYKLSEAPGIWYDEGFYSQIGMNFAAYGKQLLQVAPGDLRPNSYITVGFPFIMPLAASYKLFGTGVLPGRLVMALFILGCAFAAWNLVRKLFGQTHAAWALMLLATFPMLYGNGKSVLGEVPGIFYLLLSLVALRSLEEHDFRGWKRYALAGLAAGACVATKPIFILLLGAILIAFIIRFKKISVDWIGFIIAVAAFAIVIGVWAAFQFSGDASIGSVLADYANPYSVDNVWAQAGTNALRFVRESTPMYTLALMLVWGFSFFARRKRAEVSSIEIAAFSFCILIMIAYLRLEGWYRYLFPASTVALLFLPSSLNAVALWLKEKIHMKWLAWAPIAILFALSALQLYQTAHDSYVAQYYSGTRTHDMTEALSSIPPTSTVFLYNVPELAVLMPSRAYYQYLSPLPAVEIGKDELSVLQSGTPDMVLVDSDTYKQNTRFFSPYSVVQSVDRYVILRKPAP